VAVALERLRERLEQPALAREAFEWRLHGPIGPMTLALALTKEAESTAEAKFCLAELALSGCRLVVLIPVKLRWVAFRRPSSFNVCPRSFARSSSKFSRCRRRQGQLR
jgi:hypothetical protein